MPFCQWTNSIRTVKCKTKNINIIKFTETYTAKSSGFILAVILAISMNIRVVEYYIKLFKLTEQNDNLE